MKILVAEDDYASGLLLERTLKKGGYSVVVAPGGIEALEAIRRERFDVLLTDWMMPRMDGMELIRRVRATAKPVPLIMVITVLSSAEARAVALDGGADDYLTKPFDPTEVLARLENCLSRGHQSMPRLPAVAVHRSPTRPPFVGVCVVASTGGPPVLKEIFRSLDASRAAFFVVLHGPAWLLEAFAQRLQHATAMKVRLAEDGARVAPGEIYVAPGDRHLCVEARSLRLRLIDEPPENYLRPAADPLFRSAAKAFGRHCVAVVMTGLGCDGTLGAAHVAVAGGVVLAQDPETAVAPSMPKSVIKFGLAKRVVPLAKMAATISRYVTTLSVEIDPRSQAPKRDVRKWS